MLKQAIMIIFTLFISQNCNVNLQLRLSVISNSATKYRDMFQNIIKSTKHVNDIPVLFDATLVSDYNSEIFSYSKFVFVHRKFTFILRIFYLYTLMTTKTQ